VCRPILQFITGSLPFLQELKIGSEGIFVRDRAILSLRQSWDPRQAGVEDVTYVS